MAHLTNILLAFFLLTLFSPSLYVQSLKMPSYLTPCSASDPNINECARKSGQAGIPYFIKGDKRYKLPPLNPLEIIQISVNQGTSQVGLQINLNNCKVYGLENTVIQNISIDLANKEFVWYLKTPRIEVISKYNVSGKVLLLPIFGDGNANVTLKNPFYTYKWQYSIEKKNGVDYIIPKKGTIGYELDQVYINLENLFNGDKLLGPQMNKFLNENWMDAARELGPTLAEALSQVIDNIVKGLCQAVPYNEAFLP